VLIANTHNFDKNTLGWCAGKDGSAGELNVPGSRP
jgi:hypothetical protein